MPSVYEDVDAKCPFYKRSNKNSISCEGIVSNSSLTIGYVSPKEKATQKRVFCNDRYQNCEIYQMLMQKYEQ